MEETRARVAEREAEFAERGAFAFAAFERTSGAFVGMASLLNFDWDVPKGEVGYWLATSKVGQGFATEAARSMATLGRSIGLVRVELCCDVTNTRSRAVAGRAGFELEGVLKNERRNPQGGLRDTCVFATVG